MKICVMGAGGFIGHHLTSKLVELGHEVVGVDLEKAVLDKLARNENRYPVDKAKGSSAKWNELK